MSVVGTYTGYTKLAGLIKPSMAISNFKEVFYYAVQKISIVLPQKGLEFLGGGGLCKAKILKKCMKLNWNFQRGGGLRKKSFHGGGMDIFWNDTLLSAIVINQSQTNHLTSLAKKRDIFDQASRFQNGEMPDFFFKFELYKWQRIHSILLTYASYFLGTGSTVALFSKKTNYSEYLITFHHFNRTNSIY